MNNNQTKLSEEEVLSRLDNLQGDWYVDEDYSLLGNDFDFSDFDAVLKFVNEAAAIAKRLNHHPDICFTEDEVVIETYTTAVDGLTEKDFELANEIDKLER